MTGNSSERSARAILRKLDVPDGPDARLFVESAKALDGELEPLSMIVVQRAFLEMFKAVEELYTPKLPLDALAEHDRAVQEMHARFGMELRTADITDFPLRPVCESDGFVMRSAGDGAWLCIECGSTYVIPEMPNE